MESGADYEFRTTVVPGIHEEEDFDEIGDWIRGARRYALQEFRDVKIFDPSLAEKSRSKSLNLERIRDRLLGRLPSVEIRR